MCHIIKVYISLANKHKRISNLYKHYILVNNKLVTSNDMGLNDNKTKSQHLQLDYL